MVRTAKRLVDAELEGGAGVHDQVADARQQMLEEAPGEADQDDQAQRAAAIARVKATYSSPPPAMAASHQVRIASPAKDKADASGAVEDGYDHVRPPAPDGEMGGERSGFDVGHGWPA